MPATMLADEIKRVVPAFWKEYKKTVSTVTKSKLTGSAKSGDTWKTNLGRFLNLVSAISDRKEKNNISSKRRAKQLEREKATKCNLLAEFIKAEKSEWLIMAEEGAEDKLAKMRAVMESNGSEISSHKRWQMPKANTTEVKIDFQLTRVLDPENTNPDDM